MYDIIKNAKKYLGTPYVWGGDCEKEGGLDCSGYVYNVLNDSGIKVARTTAQGLYNLFKNNKADEKTEGALIFFGKSTSKITHVAIAAGDGKNMYESIGNSSNTIKKKGKGVTLSPLTRRKDVVAVCLPYKPEAAPKPTPTPAATPNRKYLYGGVDYSPVFDPTYYAANNRDVVSVYGTQPAQLFNHFTVYGMKEGRQGNAVFNVQKYKKNNLDLQMAYGNNLKLYYYHFCCFGRNEASRKGTY